jgi:hypothetical protein
MSTRARKINTSYGYQDEKQVSPRDVAAMTLNAVDHLGTQRFALPPFSSHFERWLVDLQSLLEEFKNRIPQAADETFSRQIDQRMNEIRTSLSEQTYKETKKSSQAAELHKKFSECDLKLSQLDREYKNDTHELRRQHAKSDQKLQSEIDALDRKRLQILRKKTNFLQRILQKPQITVQGTDAALETSKDRLRKSDASFSETLQRRRSDYLMKRQRLANEVSSLRQQIQDSSENMGDDALESRRASCREIRLIIEEAMRRTENTTQASH